MSIRRTNLVISTIGPNSILIPKADANGNTLVFDAKLGSFILQNEISAINLGNGEPVLENFIGKQLQFNTLTEGANVFISETGGEITISAATFGGPATPAIIVPNIAARDALIPSILPGNLVFVTDSSADGQGAGENSFYIWNGSSFVAFSTEDSTNTDAQTLEIIIDHNSPITNLIGQVSPSSRITNVTVNVTQEFNGADPVLTIGDDINGNSIHMDENLNDLTALGCYYTPSNFFYTGTTETEIKAYLDVSGSNQGQAQILITYV